LSAFFGESGRKEHQGCWFMVASLWILSKCPPDTSTWTGFLIAVALLLCLGFFRPLRFLFCCSLVPLSMRDLLFLNIIYKNIYQKCVSHRSGTTKLKNEMGKGHTNQNQRSEATGLKKRGSRACPGAFRPDFPRKVRETLRRWVTPSHQGNRQLPVKSGSVSPRSEEASPLASTPKV